jgi:hypothetical protein
MFYRIVLGNQPLGTSELEYHDSAMGIAFGTFHPLAPYQAVRPVFLQFTQAVPSSGETPDERKLAEYYAARDRLGLALETEDGTSMTTGFIHIVDWGEGEEDHMEVEVLVTDPRFVWKSPHLPGAH